LVREYDHEAVRRAVRDLIVGIGEDPDRDGLQDTPERVARAYLEIFAGLWQEPEDVLTTTFDLGHDEMVLVKDIEVRSMCEHHLVPFFGVAHVGYIPSHDGRITGLSKLARLVDVYARRPQVQERMTTQVADSLMRILERQPGYEGWKPSFGHGIAFPDGTYDTPAHPGAPANRTTPDAAREPATCQRPVTGASTSWRPGAVLR
jgi:GTP cyclohydrolase I